MEEFELFIKLYYLQRKCSFCEFDESNDRPHCFFDRKKGYFCLYEIKSQIVPYSEKDILAEKYPNCFRSYAEVKKQYDIYENLYLQAIIDNNIDVAYCDTDNLLKKYKLTNNIN